MTHEPFFEDRDCLGRNTRTSSLTALERCGGGVYGRRHGRRHLRTPAACRRLRRARSRSRDLDVYAQVVDDLGARRVLDVGCGTGTFALLLVDRGIDVVGVDPAGGLLLVAQSKLGADRVRWIHGDATSLPLMQVDLQR